MPFQLKPLPDHHKKSSTPQGPNKFATIVSEEAKRLIAMDRYERRALFRRKNAIQAFDEASARLQIEVADRDPRGNSAADSRKRE
jgi:hypothetical protein